MEYTDWLISKDFVDIGRAADMLWLSFGKEITIKIHDQKSRVVNEFALHLQCPWRFIQKGLIILANADIYDVTNDKDYDYDEWDVLGNNRFDKAVEETMSPMLPLKVEQFCTDSKRDIKILFGQGLVFETFINASSPSENWRLINFATREHIIYWEED
jgi:hypothetical protein